MMGFETTLDAGEIIDLWLRPAAQASTSRVSIQDGGGREIELVGGPTDDFERKSYRAAARGQVGLAWDGATTAVSLAYSYAPDEVFERGIRLLWTTPDNVNGARRFRLHLQPPWGWMNDPNGLFETGGTTHAFYQHYPHARRWNTMHWGHAISRNLIDWVHLPVFLDPRRELLNDDAKSGGAFSGSAVPGPNGTARIFYTDRQDDREPNWEWQMTAVSTDLITAGPARAIVTERPPIPGFRRDMRDAYVFRGPDGLWKMLLGGADAEGGVVLLYESAEPDGADGWKLIGPAYTDRLPAGVPVECPSMVPLSGEGEGLYVLVFSLLGLRDESTRRRNLSYAVVGRFDGRSFEAIARRELDFGTDSYAFQAFRHAEHGPMGIAWAANWTDVFRDRDFPSAMTFPRLLVWQQGSLFTPPVPTVAELREKSLLEGRAGLTQPVALPNGLAEIEIEFAARGADFVVEFTHASHRLALVSSGSTLELQFEPPGFRAVPRYIAEGASPTRLRIFIDVGLIEIYADDGRWCATKRIDSDAPITAFKLASGLENVREARVWALRPARALP